MYSLYPNIVYKIKKAFKDLKLTDIEETPEYFIEKKRRFYSTICKTKRGEKVFFKSLLARKRGRRNRFLNEINFYKALRKNPQHPLADFCPQLLTSSVSPSFSYFLYKFIPGKTRESKDRFKKEELKEIVRIMKIITSSPVNIFQFIPKTPLFKFELYKNKVFLFLKNISLEKGTKEKIKKFIYQNQKIFYNVKGCLSHGDFSEANTVYYKDKIKVVDWEHVHLRNPLYDFAEFWVKRRRFPEEQKILKTEYFKGIKDRDLYNRLFKLALFEICIRDMVHFEGVIADLKKKPSEYIDAIRTTYLRQKEYLKIINKIL